MAGFALTSEQDQAIRLFLTGKSLAIQAGAGTGKTSTLVKIAEAALPTGRRGQYIAFNRDIVEDARKKFPRNVECNTAHSLAKRAVGNPFFHRLPPARMKSTELALHIGTTPFTITVGKGADAVAKTLSASFLAGLAMRAVKQFCQTADEAPSRRHVPYVDGIDDPDEDGARTYRNNNAVAAHVEPFLARVWADWTNPDGVLPYDHAAYLKLWQLSDPKIPADFILFDEAQDANPVMRAIVAAQTHAQVVYVGDSQQEIYAWAGAVNALEQTQTDNRTFLTKSFRFGPAIAAQANRVLSAIPSAELRLSGFDKIASVVAELPNPDAVLCRTNARAMSEVLTAIDAGQRVHLVGGGGEVAAFVRAAKRLMDGLPVDHPELACFDSWGDVQEYVEQDEQGGDLRLMVRLIDEFGVDAIIDAINQMPKKQEDADLIVSTAHKAKGREWNRVRLAGDFPEAPGVEELRLLYVALTRAKEHLDITAVTWFNLAADGSAASSPPETPAKAPGASEEPLEASSDGARAGGQHVSPLAAPMSPEETIEVLRGLAAHNPEMTVAAALALVGKDD